MSILDGISLAVKRGEALAIVGPSGSGKSTLLGLLAGLDEASGGEVILLGQDLRELDEDARAWLRAGRVGFVFQSFQLLQGFTALENVMLAMELGGGDNSTESAVAMLDKLGLGQRLQHYPEQLSGGEQQRVALARAFVVKPALLFADEPTGNLDADNGHKIIDLMFDLRAEQGASLVLVTHDLALAERCDRTLIIRDGRVSQQ
ncbi:MAG: ATP-binding cassette domain-containing protein [Gammaproteobacteria bacterium]|nr:ATP-binding cassette domain-containing protein [Gammaproteobacteria bacterium]